MPRLRSAIRNSINKTLLKVTGFAIVRSSTLDQINIGESQISTQVKSDSVPEGFMINMPVYEQYQKSQLLAKMPSLLQDLDMPNDLVEYLVMHFELSNSQLWQDVLVTYLFDGESGTFFDIGAADGKTMSNTYLLEKSYGWGGVVVEPAHYWWERLKINRNCAIELASAWSQSGMSLKFLETLDPLVSSLDATLPDDSHASSRHLAKEYLVDTLSANDILTKHGVTKVDYLSLDTEGSEYSILSKCDLLDFGVKFITVEHNNTAQYYRIHGFLVDKGYKQILKNFSNWEAWFVKEDAFDLVTYKFKKMPS